MNKVQSKKFVILQAVMLIALLALTACSGGPAATAAGTTVPTATTAPVTAACPIGNWQLTNFGNYMASMASQIGNTTSQDLTVTDQGSTGSAQFTFNADGTSKLTTVDFVESFSMDMNIGGNVMSIPVTLKINGTSTAKYTINGDQITFTDQNAGDMVITEVSAGGDPTVLSMDMLGDPGTDKLYQFSCPDANSLSLKVIAVTNMDLAPLILTRVP
jgi:hypothetical protein